MSVRTVRLSLHPCRIVAHARYARRLIAQLLRMAPRIVCGALCCTIAAPAVSHASVCKSGCAADSNTIERITSFVFAPSITTSGYTRSVVYAARGHSFEGLEEINKYNIRSAHMVQGTAQRLDLVERPIESHYWWSIQTQSGARQFIIGLAAVLERELKSLDHVGLHARGTAIRKALAQRDMAHTYSLLTIALSTASDDETRLLGARLEGVLVAILRALLLTDREYQQLRSLLPKRIPTHFSTVPDDTLADSYLPSRVVAQDDSWLEIPGGGEPFRHYTSYGGRSFIKVYIRAPRYTTEQISQLWRSLFRRYGAALHTTGIEESTPAGLETMLVRTFGVFLQGGDYTDSMWPEEVTIRRFKYAAERVDHSSSDFRGTQFFQYKLSRSLVREEPASLGLRRVLDDDRQFYGFFGDVPDRGNSYSDAVTTMRANCIACHAELFYGLSTIFSFERDPDKTPRERSLAAESEEIKVLQSRLRQRSRSMSALQMFKEMSHDIVR